VKSNIILLLGLLIIAGCGDQSGDTGTEISVPVSVEEIKLKPIEEFISTTGTVKATNEVILKSETSGFYRLAINPKTKAPYKLGDFVQKDSAIIYLDNPELENNTKIEPGNF